MSMQVTKVDAWDSESAINSLIPEFDTPQKQEFLFYRACYFNIVECFQLARINRSLFRQWMNTDPDFAYWYKNKLFEIQKHVGPKLVKLQFIRNMTLSLRVDSEILQTAAFDGVEGLTEREADILDKAQSRYKAADLAALVRALDEEDHGGIPETQVNVTFTVPGREVISEEARRAGLRQLLDDFTQRDEVIEGDWVEADGYGSEPNPEAG